MTHFWKLMFARHIAFAPEDGTGTPPAGDGAPLDEAGDPPPAAAPAPAANAKWFESTEFKDHLDWLTARGLADDNKDAVLLKAIKGHRAAEQRLGNKPEDLLTKPKEGQSLTEWLKEQRGALGLPDKADAYQIDAPQDWPKEIPWDTDMAGKVREIAFEHGLAPDAVQAMVGVYAAKVQQMEQASAQMLQQATDVMMQDLRKDWGQQTDAKITLAKQAAGVIAEKAGLSGEALQNLTGVLSDKVGDANVLRLFAALGDMVADDAGAGLGKGANKFTMTPADARAEIARISAPDGPYAKAVAGTDPGEKQRWNQRMIELSKIAAS